ncbi:MAG: molecular chaperone TorD family protein [bacterium]|nr:molecular chaperone TorD family protein [bacterium]
MSQASTPDVHELMAEAAAWRLMGLLMERPRPGWNEELDTLAREVVDPSLRAAVEAARGASEGTYLGLLGPGGFISPREVAYRPKEDPGKILADLAGFYEAFAFAPQAEDPIDHIAVEAGFVAYLRMKEAYALARGDEEAAETTAESLNHFLDSHLGAFVESFVRSLEPSGVPYLIATAHAILRKVKEPVNQEPEASAP